MMTLLRRYPASAGLLAGGLVAAAFGAFVSTTVTTTVTETAPDKAASAKRQITYERYCVSCHGKTARGDGPLAKELRVAVPDLTLLAKRAGGTYPVERVSMVISKGSQVRAHGTDDMPAWGTAFNRTDGTEASVDEAIRNLVGFLGSIQR
jgi:mono/diheme cytochrome c family protein